MWTIQFFLWILLNSRFYIPVQHLHFYSFDTGWLTNIKRNLPVKIQSKSITLQRRRKKKRKTCFCPIWHFRALGHCGFFWFSQVSGWLGGPELFSDWGESEEVLQQFSKISCCDLATSLLCSWHPVALARSSGTGLSSWGSPLIL